MEAEEARAKSIEVEEESKRAEEANIIRFMKNRYRGR